MNRKDFLKTGSLAAASFAPTPRTPVICNRKDFFANHKHAGNVLAILSCDFVLYAPVCY